MLGMQELVDVAGVEVIGTNRLRLPFANATVGQVDFGEWPLPVLISRSFAAGDTFVTSTPLWGLRSFRVTAVLPWASRVRGTHC